MRMFCRQQGKVLFSQRLVTAAPHLRELQPTPEGGGWAAHQLVWPL